MVQEMCYVCMSDMMNIHEQDGHLGLLRLHSHWEALRDLCKNVKRGFVIQTKISNGFLPRNKKPKRGHSSPNALSSQD